MILLAKEVPGRVIHLYVITWDEVHWLWSWACGEVLWATLQRTRSREVYHANPSSDADSFAQTCLLVLNNHLGGRWLGLERFEGD